MGGCDRVRACFEAVKSGILKNLTPIAIIDRDYRTADEIAEFKSFGIYVLSVHELESIFGLEHVFVALAKHLGKSEQDAKQSFIQLKEKVKANLKPTINKVVLERSKKQALRKAQIHINSVPCSAEFSDMNTKFQTAITGFNNELTQLEIMRAEKEQLENAIQSSWDQTLEYFPGKSVISKVEEVLGIDKSVLVSLIENAFKIQNGAFTDLRVSLESALANHLPNR